MQILSSLIERASLLASFWFTKNDGVFMLCQAKHLTDVDVRNRELILPLI